MKNIIKIFKEDLKDILSNKSVLIILTGLLILPSLYAWFNIKASWDPYGHTSNIAVAVVNKDKGATLLDRNINIGDQLVDTLKKNKALGWKFVNEQDAKNGVETGKYYASIEITEDFSKNVTSVLGNDLNKAKIIYTVNQKINAIVPKITDKGASSIQQQVNQTIVKVASEAVFETMNNLGISLQENLPELEKIEVSLMDVQSKFDKIYDILGTAEDASNKINEISKTLEDNMPLIESTIKNSQGLSSDIKDFLENTKTTASEISPTIKSDLQIINSISGSISAGIKNLITSLEQGVENAPEIIDGLESKLDNLSSLSSSLSNFLSKLDKITPGTTIKDTISSINSINSSLESVKNILEDIKLQVNNGQTSSFDKLNQIVKVINDINNISGSILNNYDDNIVKPLNDIFSKGITVSGNVLDLLENAEASLPKINDTLDSIVNFTGNANEGIAYIEEKLPGAKSVLDNLVSALSAVNNSEEMKNLINFLKNDVIAHADFIKEPVELVTNIIYPLANYGAGMTPFYTVLSFWVGILLLSSILTTEVHEEYKPYEEYFGRGLTFLTMSLLQSLITSVGDIVILGVKMTNPILFVMLSLLITTVFTFILYSFVSVFGNIGKALGVILLVIQISGSGGTYPVDVMPQFFQVVNPFLPFTYGISALREAVAGIYMPNLYRDIIILLMFLVLFIVLNVLLKGPINKALYKFTARMKESRLIGH